MERRDWERWIAASYEAAVGQPLAAPDELYDLPAVVLCHDRSPDPLFVYANRTAQALWERSWEDFIGWPSRLTAPPEERSGRAEALAEPVLVTGYRGIRISATGARFSISGATVWPVADDAGSLVGQAATFTQWSPLPG